MSVIHIKSKFDAEFRRFSIPINADGIAAGYAEFKKFVEDIHGLHNIPFTLCYTSAAGDLLPITNDENFRKAFESAQPCLRLLIQRKGESWEEKYGYGTDSTERKRKGLSLLMPATNKQNRRNYNISNPEDFRQVSAIIDVDVVPDTHRRVRLCKHGTDRPLGFYIRTSSALRQTTQGDLVKTDGIFISRLVEGGLAESTGLLGIDDEVIEVNGIDVQGKTIDQVTDMMVANAHNLIVTIKPANQRNTLNHRTAARQHYELENNRSHGSTNMDYNRGGEGRHSAASSGFSTSEKGRYLRGAAPAPPPALSSTNNPHHQDSYDSEDDEEEDEIVDHTNSTTYRIR